jgi:hypothetical protein
MADSDDERYLYTVQYDGEAERKRVEYLFNNWDDGQIDTPSGLVRTAENIDHEELYEQIATKVPEDQIEVHRLQSATPDVESETIKIQQEVEASIDAVEGFLDYMLSKKKAVLQSASRNEYEMYTKKGRADVSYTLRESDGGTVTVGVRVTGVPPAPSFLADFFETELSEYATSQSG